MRFVLAYLDPGSGSLIVQVLLGGAAGVAVMMKTMGRRWFKRDQEQGAEAEQADPEALPQSGHEEIVDRASNSPGDPA
jgi:hypothetical protein